MAYNVNPWGTGYGTWMGYPSSTVQQTQQIQQPQQPQQPQQIQNGGFVIAPSEEFARNYPVAPGTKVTFKDENLPYLYTKMAGFSLLDQPVFEKFKLIKEGDEAAGTEGKSGLELLEEAVSEMRKDVNALKEYVYKRNHPDKRKGEKND